jgi:uncharacterized SAM-binding protein YcdF (DUF218 family)
LFFALLFGYWFLSTPFGSGLLQAGLSDGLTPLSTRDQARGADTIVLLGGGSITLSGDGTILGQLTQSSGLRAIEAARLYRLIGARQIIASGGIPYPTFQLKPESEVLARALVEAGVPARDIVQEGTSRTTREQAQIIGTMLRGKGVRRVVLVTTPSHMHRALGVFRAQGLDPIPAISRLRSQHLPPAPWFWPNDGSLLESGEAVYDAAAWVYYWWNGWLSPAY